MPPVAIFEAPTSGPKRFGRRRMSAVRNARQIFKIMRRTAKQLATWTNLVSKDLIEGALVGGSVNSPLLITLNLNGAGLKVHDMTRLGAALPATWPRRPEAQPPRSGGLR